MRTPQRMRYYVTLYVGGDRRESVWGMTPESASKKALTAQRRYKKQGVNVVLPTCVHRLCSDGTSVGLSDPLNYAHNIGEKVY